MIEPFTTIRYVNQNGRRARITYHPEWSVSRPWASYIGGSAGRHFENEKQADSYFEGLDFKKVTV